MVGNKGFVYIVEVVLISMVLIVSLSFLIKPLDIDENWEAVELERIGESALISAHRQENIKKSIFNETPYLDSRLDSIIHEVGGRIDVRYNLILENLYPRKITVGFNCTGSSCIGDPDEERTLLRETLDSVWMNNRSIEFEVKKTDIEGGIEGIDVFFIRGEEQLEKADERSDELRDFVESGGGVVQFTDYSNVEERDIQQSIFGLGSSGGVPDALAFKNREDPSESNYEPSKLFYGKGSWVSASYRIEDLTKKVGTWKIRSDEYTVEVSEDKKVNITENGNMICERCDENDTFQLDIGQFIIRNIEERKDGVYKENVLVHFDYPQGYEFTGSSFRSSTEVEDKRTVLGDSSSVWVVNKVGEGRASWISEGDYGGIGEDMEDDIKSLLQTSVVWTAPREEWIKEADGRPEGTVSKTTHFGSINEDIYEPYKLTMELWYAY